MQLQFNNNNNIIIFKIYIAPLTYKMIKGAEHVLKSTEWKKKQKRKTGHQASAQTKVWGYICPANRELIVTYYIGLSLLASVMS